MALLGLRGEPGQKGRDGRDAGVRGDGAERKSDYAGLECASPVFINVLSVNDR